MDTNHQTQIQMAYIRFAEQVKALPLTEVDVFDTILGLVATPSTLPTGLALMAHARDLYREITSGRLPSMTPGDILAESYRLTFCDHVGAHRYGTQGALNNPAVVQLFDGLTVALQESAKGNAQQYIDTLAADESNRH